MSPLLRSLNLHLNRLTEIPVLRGCSQLKLLDLSNNAIGSIGLKSFEDLSLLHDLLLQYNHISHIPSDAFRGLGQLQILNLEHNRITSIDPGAFLPLVSLEDINLGNNIFPDIPAAGLEHVVSLKVHNNPYLRVFPGRDSFPGVNTLVLSYAYHCCPFLEIQDEINTPSDPGIHENVVFSVEELERLDPKLWNHSHVWPHVESMLSSGPGVVWPKMDPTLSAVTSSDHYRSSIVSNLRDTPETHVLLRDEGKPQSFENSTFVGKSRNGFTVTQQQHQAVHCIPQPGPFMPCRDLFDWWTLRCGVWLVFLLALMGNGAVVIVLVTAYAKMDVPRFLVANLALADFFMGIYLGFLAVVDASTLGEFRMYAIPWQMSAGCQFAGFLGVLSSELSVYTLTVITLERNYAITNAMHLNKRLSLRHAAYIMAVGWVFALTVAILPLTGVSDYRKFAVCLPFETDGPGLGYVVFLMFINGIAFLILMGCYLKIYCAIRGSQAWNSNDSRIAKRMALLVFTDFICWAPIAFFSLSSAYGLQLISLEGAKVFTVFVLPLNSCCNPFLYALLTKQFKKDCVMLCKTIEESRVTRGIGRCRHSSNFSNRQTPANTNSALDQTSRDERQSCNCHHHAPRKGFVRSLLYSLQHCCQKELEPYANGSSSTQPIGSPAKGKLLRTLTSDIGSSSWTGVWKRTQSATTLRLLELRRQASLDLTRKSSQESNMSSRNDSSGTSASTATLRMSRSSVSSDASLAGGRTRGDTQHRSSSLREGKCNTQRERVAPSTASIKIQPVLNGQAETEVPQKPRLQRQRAVERDSGGSTRFTNGNPNCPLHPLGDHLSCVYEQDSTESDKVPVEETAAKTCIPARFIQYRSLSDSQLLCRLGKPPDAKNSVPKMSIDSNKNPSIVQANQEKLSGLLETHFPLEEQPEESKPLIFR